jgi:DNA polymerase III alpha subunit
MDFCERRRGEVIDYVKRKYGEDRVAQIVTFNTLKAKNAVRSVAKAMGLTFAEENELVRDIPNALNIKLAQALESSKNLREKYENDPRVRGSSTRPWRLEEYAQGLRHPRRRRGHYQGPRIHLVPPDPVQKGRLHRHPVRHDTLEELAF